MSNITDVPESVEAPSVGSEQNLEPQQQIDPAEDVDVSVSAEPPKLTKKQQLLEQRRALKEARAKVKELMNAKKRAQNDKKRILAIQPPKDVVLPRAKKLKIDIEVNKENVEPDTTIARVGDEIENDEEEDDEEEEEEEDEVGSFARSLRSYMDAYVYKSLQEYKKNPVAAAEKDFNEAATRHAPIPVETRKPLAMPTQNLRERDRTPIFFA